jgi:hypothetical protein
MATRPNFNHFVSKIARGSKAGDGHDLGITFPVFVSGANYLAG